MVDKINRRERRWTLEDYQLQMVIGPAIPSLPNRILWQAAENAATTERFCMILTVQSYN